MQAKMQNDLSLSVLLDRPVIIIERAEREERQRGKRGRESRAEITLY